MNCTNCGKPESSHPVVPWFGKKCYEFIAPEPPKPRSVLVEFYRGSSPQFSILSTPEQARVIARRLNTMADIIDPPKKESLPDHPPEDDGGGETTASPNPRDR